MLNHLHRITSKIKYPISPLLSPFPFSTNDASINNPPTPLNQHQHTNLNESNVIKQLSSLLPIRNPNSIPKFYPQIQNPTQTRPPPDGFLSLEDKLCGIFLQKLKAKSLIQNALNAALADAQLSIDVVSRVLGSGNLGAESMVLFFNWAVEKPGVGKDLGFYNLILKALGRRKFFDCMVDKLREMGINGIGSNCETLMIVFDSFVRARQIARAVEMFRKLEKFGISCDNEGFNVLLRCLCKRSHVGTANSLLNSMKEKVVFDCESYDVVIGGWAKLGRVREMEKCLKLMVEDGFSPNCETYSFLIEGLGRAGRVDDAVKIFRSMEGDDCLPDTSAYNAMICNYLSVGDFVECLKYYDEMLRNNCMPNIHTYTKLICGLLKARKVADALELFDKMLLQGIIPTTGTITLFIEPLCSYGPPEAAMMVYRSAKKAGCRLSPTAYKLLLMRLSRFGKCGMLLKLWDEMQECGYSSDLEVYEYVIDGLCNNGQLDVAVFVMEEALRKGFCPSRLMCSKLNKKLVAFNKTESAYKLYLKIKQARVSENARRNWRANGWHF